MLNNWADVLTEALVPKKNKDTQEVIIDSKEGYRLTVTEKGDWYFLLVTYVKEHRKIDIMSEDSD